MPINLARTELGVRPTIAFLTTQQQSSTDAVDGARPPPSVEDTLIPRLDAKEVAAVFTAPFHNFLKASDEKRQHTHISTSASASPDGAGVEAAGFPSEWYKGAWTDWQESRWRMHNFYVKLHPILGEHVAKALITVTGSDHGPEGRETSARQARVEPSIQRTRTRRQQGPAGWPHAVSSLWHDGQDTGRCRQSSVWRGS